MPLAVVVLAFLVRLRGLGDMPLWYDEIITLNRATLGFRDVIADSLANMHYPTFFLLAKPFAGLGAEALRLPSALFSALTAGLAAILVRRLAVCAWTGAVAGLLLALAPFQVLYGQEARAYALLTLAITVAIAGLLRLAEAPDPARDRAGWVLWAGGTAVALCTMPLGIPWLLVSLIVFAALVRHRPAAGRRPLLARGAVALAVVLACWLPLLAGVLGPMEQTVSSGTWVPPTTAKAVRTALSSAFLFRLNDPLAFEPVHMGLRAFGLMVVAAALVGLWRLRGRPLVLLTLLAATVTLPLLLLAVSAVSPVFIPRYLVWVGVPFALLAAVGFGAMAARARPAAAMLLLVLGLWNLEPYYRSELKPDWPGALSAAWAEAMPGDAVYLGSALDHFAAHVLEKAGRSGFPAADRLGTEEEARTRLEAGGALWIIDVRTRKRAGETLATLPAGLDVLGKVETAKPFGRRVTLYRVVPAKPGAARPRNG